MKIPVTHVKMTPEEQKRFEPSSGSQTVTLVVHDSEREKPKVNLMPKDTKTESKIPRAPLTLEKLRELDEDENHVLEIIKDIIRVNQGSGAHDEIVIRQARREGLSERKTKEILTILEHLKIIVEYPTGYRPIGQ